MYALRSIVVPLTLAASLTACLAEQETPTTEREAQIEADALWDTVEGYQQWETAGDDEIRVYSEEPAVIEGSRLAAEGPAGTYVVVEHLDDGEVIAIEILEAHGTGQAWSSTWLSPDGALVEDQFRSSCEACHSSW